MRLSGASSIFFKFSNSSSTTSELGMSDKQYQHSRVQRAHMAQTLNYVLVYH